MGGLEIVGSFEESFFDRVLDDGISCPIDRWSVQQYDTSVH